MIPDRWGTSEKYFRHVFETNFPGVDVVGTRSFPGGSNDLFAIIDRRDVEDMQDWRDLILQTIPQIVDTDE